MDHDGVAADRGGLTDDNPRDPAPKDPSGEADRAGWRPYDPDGPDCWGASTMVSDDDEDEVWQRQRRSASPLRPDGRSASPLGTVRPALGSRSIGAGPRRPRDKYDDDTDDNGYSGASSYEDDYDDDMRRSAHVEARGLLGPNGRSTASLRSRGSVTCEDDIPDDDARQDDRATSPRTRRLLEKRDRERTDCGTALAGKLNWAPISRDALPTDGDSPRDPSGCTAIEEGDEKIDIISPRPQFPQRREMPPAIPRRQDKERFARDPDFAAFNVPVVATLHGRLGINFIEAEPPPRVDDRSVGHRPCNYATYGKRCPYGDSCRYSHERAPRRRENTATNNNFAPPHRMDNVGGAPTPPPAERTKKIWFCRRHLAGRCANANECVFAHSADELSLHVERCRFGGNCKAVVTTDDQQRWYENVDEQRKCVRLHPRETIDNYLERTQQIKLPMGGKRVVGVRGGVTTTTNVLNNNHLGVGVIGALPPRRPIGAARTPAIGFAA
jgi:hypothetical protein